MVVQKIPEKTETQDRELNGSDRVEITRYILILFYFNLPLKLCMTALVMWLS